MKLLKLIVLSCVMAAVAGCMQTEPVSRNVTPELGILAPNTPVLRSYEVQDVRIVVPQDLTVSEANSIKPRADIVWRGDAMGDRHEQLRVLFEEAASLGAERLDGQIPVVVDLQLTKFHGLTQRTRYNFGGDYDVHFILTVRHALTGEVIEGPRMVEAVLDNPSGDQVVAMEQRGVTERLFVSSFLVATLVDELSGTADPATLF